MATTCHPDLASLPYEEFKAYIEKALPGEDAEALYIAAGGKLTKKDMKVKDSAQEKGEGK
jgi:hypothetical protein